jgi:acetoacetyl-CoA reductase
MVRVALVIGGTRGTGEAICIVLANKGFTVVTNYGGNDERAKAFTAETGTPSY